MIPDLNQAIFETKNIIDRNSQLGSFDEFSSVYFWTTEDISYYLMHTYFNKNKALSVIGSGDQIFNLICLGVKHIDAFDINQLTYYLYYLKRAVLLSYDYFLFKEIEHQGFFISDFVSFRDMFLEIKSCMPKDVATYYQVILEYLNCHSTYELYSLYRGGMRGVENFNFYFNDETEYLKTQENIKHAKVRFYFDDVMQIPSLVSRRYDLILLSNIYDYLCLGLEGDISQSIEHFKKYIAHFLPLLSKNGVLINYFINPNPSLFYGIYENIMRTYNGQRYYMIRQKKKSNLKFPF